MPLAIKSNFFDAMRFSILSIGAAERPVARLLCPPTDGHHCHSIPLSTGLTQLCACVRAAGIWTYRVDPEASKRVVADVDSRNDKERITVWVPLTEATIGNGCMYLIPQDRVLPTLPACYLNWTAVSHDELGTLLRNVTPLPGSILGWNDSLIHWGGRALESAAFPRIPRGRAQKLGNGCF
jgi:hypothetical protein